MNKCQHNQKIQFFCVSQHCEWKQAGGCQQCIKKYHNHIGNAKIISEEQSQLMLKKFNVDHSYKPNCRLIQQSVYTYFTALKNEMVNSLELICKTYITQLGSPYMFANNFYTVYKRIKHNEYKKINQKDFRKLYDASKKVNINELSKQEGKIYKQQLKKNHKFMLTLQNLMTSYETLFKPLLENFKHQKNTFQQLNNLIKQTIQSSQQTISISQFHEKYLQKNKNQKDKQKEKQKTKQKQKKQLNTSQAINGQNSARLSSVNKQKPKIQPHSQLFTTNKQENQIQTTNNNYRLGVRDFNAIEKGQSKEFQKAKREISLDKKITNTNSSSTHTQSSTLTHERRKSDLTLLEDFKIESDKRKIYTLDKKYDLNAQLFSDSVSIKKSQTSESLPKQKKQLNTKDKEINIRKQMLIGMMKNHTVVNNSINATKSHQREKSNLFQDKLYENQSFLKYNKNVSNLSFFAANEEPQHQKVPIAFPKAQGTVFGVSIGINSDSPIRKNPGLMVQTKRITEYNQKKIMELSQVKVQGNSNCETSNLPKWQIKSIEHIESDDEPGSQGSLKNIKKIILKSNMKAHSKLPIQQTQEKKKEIGCSRLIIVPAPEKFKMQKSDECDSPLLKRKVNLSKNYPNEGNQKLQKVSKQQKPQSPSPKLQKGQLKQNQERSLNLLLKSIHAKPDEAISILQLAMKEASNNLSAAEYLSYLYLQNNKPRQCLIVCNIILDRFEIITKENEELLMNLQINKSAALNMLGRYSQAIVLLQTYLKFKQKDTLLKNLGDAYYFNSNYQKALYYYQRTLKLNGNYDEALYNSSVCLYLQNNFHNAKISILRAIQLSPRNADYMELKRNIDERLINQTQSFKTQ